ncbi:MAG: hemolysin III family protein [Eubacteriales bacterium]|nr:hemolysin III family protein [Eubacteriales bacterium]
MPIYFRQAREPMNSFTHFIGACFGAIATIVFPLVWWAQGGTKLHTLIGSMIFGISLIALYTASSIYHYVKAAPPVIKKLRKLDHGMIFVLIAGTYTPICLGFMSFRDAALFLGIIWSVALVGNLIKIFWMSAPRWLSTALYLIMGWAIVFDLKAFVEIPAACLALIACGGISYSVGAVFYVLKKPNFSLFGFHELFHLLVILGSAFHFAAVLLFVL